MEKIFILIGITLAVIFSMGLSAEEKIFNAKLVSEPFNESYQPTVLVSGRTLVGVMFVSSAESSSISFQLPQNIGSKEVCLVVQSRDGAYFSSNTYLVSNLTEATASVIANYPTRYRALLKSFEEEELGILASEGNCAETNSNQFFLANRGSGSSEEILLMVNSSRSDVFLNLTNTKESKSIRCNRIRDGVRTSFDTTCRIKKELLENYHGDVLLVRRQGSRVLPPISLTISL
ncbi:MAG: hypothetical protein LAT53_11935 [Idiomarina sp.]|nr:hypothetical protein [Idiomarina sp.]